MSLARHVLLAMCGCILVNCQLNIGQFNTGQFNTGQFSTGQFNPGQLWGVNNLRTSWGNQANVGWWNGPLGGRSQQFRTCIGRTNYGDELRVTFKTEEPDTRNNWAFNWNRRDSLRFTAVVNARSNLRGQFTFVVTRYGRVDGTCHSRALGEVLSSNNWWNQNRIRGVIGSPVTLMPGQVSTSSERLDTFTLDELNGHGLALCQTTRLSGTTCFDTIYMCCQIARDKDDVTLGYMRGQFMPGGTMGSGAIGGGISGTGNLGGGGGIIGGTLGSGPTFGGGPSLPTGADSNQPQTEFEAGQNGLGTLTFGRK